MISTTTLTFILNREKDQRKNPTTWKIQKRKCTVIQQNLFTCNTNYSHCFPLLILQLPQTNTEDTDTSCYTAWV